MKPSGILIRSALIAALGGLLFGFDTAVISGTTGWLKSGFVSEIAEEVYRLAPSISEESVLGFMLGLLWVLFVMPETKGISLEKIQQELGIE